MLQRYDKTRNGRSESSTFGRDALARLATLPVLIDPGANYKMIQYSKGTWCPITNCPRTITTEERSRMPRTRSPHSSTLTPDIHTRPSSPQSSRLVIRYA